MVPNPANPQDRQTLVDQVREMVQKHFPGENWHDRCPHVAYHTVYVLNQYGLTGYEVVAGRVEEVGADRPVVLFKGTYTGTGLSEYHTWVVGPRAEKLDFSIVPKRYRKDYVWEDYESLPGLRYSCIAATTEAVIADLESSYRSVQPRR